jgi:16S rRNA (cytosine967-C5)-methyltransferase
VGDKLELMLHANNEAPDMVIQTNTLKISTQELVKRLEEEGVSVKNHPWMIDCLVLADTGRLEQLPAFQEGLFYVQDAAAKLAVLCAQLPKDAKVLDCCAAPGGKSFAAAIAMGGTGHITSCDVHEHKISLIEGGASRLGFSNITAGVQDASACNDAWLSQMDVVIADVPCSGYGIIRKKPDIRLKDPDTMMELPQLQLAILKNQARYVKPGGVLLYSTCTVLKRENEDVVEAFLKENPEFTREKLELPDVFPDNTDGMLTLVPGQYDTDGFFICRMRRNG